MAMTIEQQPAYKLQPAGSDWIFTISSTNVSGNYKYKFIIDLQIAQAAPSMATMIATDIALIPLTGGVGALVNKARMGKKFLDTYKGISGARIS